MTCPKTAKKLVDFVAKKKNAKVCSEISSLHITLDLSTFCKQNADKCDTDEQRDTMKTVCPLTCKSELFNLLLLLKTIKVL
jgi:hypothetical protein